MVKLTVIQGGLKPLSAKEQWIVNVARAAPREQLAEVAAAVQKIVAIGRRQRERQFYVSQADLFVRGPRYQQGGILYLTA